MKQITLQIKVFIILILFILPCNAIAAEKFTPAGSKQGPEIFVQLGHSGWVQSAAVSEDGRYLLSGGWGGNAKLWDVQTGREIRTFKDAGEFSVAISPDGKYALSGGSYGKMKLWDTYSGGEIQTFTPPGAYSVAFSRDGKYFMAKSLYGKAIMLWETSTRRQVGDLNLEESSGIHVILSHDGRYALSMNGMNSKEPLKVWDVIEGRIIKTFNSSLFYNAVFSPDNKYVLSQPDRTLVLWDIATGREVNSFAGHTGSVDFLAMPSKCDCAISASKDDGTVRLWDLLSGRNLKTFSLPPGFMPLEVSADGKTILFRDDDVIKYIFKLFDSTTGDEIRTFSKKTDGTESAVFSPDGRNVVLNSFGKIRLWDARNDKEVKSYEGHGQTVYFVAFSPNGKYAAIVNHEKTVNVWDFTTMGIVVTLKGHTQPVTSVAFSPDNKYIVSGSLDETIRLWEVNGGKEVKTLYGHKGGVVAVAFSPDGKHVLSGGQDATVRYFNVVTGKAEKIFTGHIFRQQDDRNYFTGVYAVALSPDGKYAVSGGTDSTIRLWNIVTGKEVKTFKGHLQDVTSVAFSPDGKYVLSGSMDGTLKVWEASSGKELKTMDHDSINRHVLYTSFSYDGRYALSSDVNEIVRLWDIDTEEEVRRFIGEKTNLSMISVIKSANFTPDGKHILTFDSAGVVARLWDIASGKEIAQFISFTDGEWVIIMPEGYFNASPNGAKHLNVRVRNNVYSIDNFYEKFFNPVYVASVLQGKKVEAVADIRKGFLTPPDVKITSPEPNKEFSTDTITITVSAKDTGGGIDEIRLYHNGKAIGEDTRGVKIVPKGNEVVKDYTVALVDGINTFRAVGFSKDRTESNPYELIVKLTAPQKDVSMYIFAVGINKYKNPALNLNYAEPDAKGIADFFKQKGKGLFKNVELREIYNEQATKETIISKLSQLQNTNPQDAVLIYLAGHGENINDKWYFIPYELTYPEREEDVKTKAISSDELSGYIKNIKAQKILMLIDACKSGAVLIAFRGFEDRKALSQLSRSTGVHIVAASTKNQFAAEVKELGHGVFTYILLEGLKGKAAGKGETVTVLKLMGYIQEQLPEITKKYKQEAQYPVVDSRGMDFPLILVK